MALYIAIDDTTVASVVETYLTGLNLHPVRIAQAALDTYLGQGGSDATVVTDLPADRRARALLCRSLRRRSLVQGTSVIVIRDLPDRASQLQYATAAHNVLGKPFALARLGQAVASLTERLGARPPDAPAFAQPADMGWHN